MDTRAWAKRLLILIAAVPVAIQFVPYGWRHDNPPAVSEPNWDSPRTKALFDATCADCHSNDTRWPWYSYVAPVSWIVRRDVEEARAEFNVSEIDRTIGEAGEAAKMVRSGEMPLPIYTFAHKEARLTPERREELAAGLEATFGR